MEDDENQLTPIITDDGYTFLYVKHNNLYRQSPYGYCIAMTRILHCINLSLAEPSYLHACSHIACCVSTCFCCSHGDVKTKCERDGELEILLPFDSSHCPRAHKHLVA